MRSQPCGGRHVFRVGAQSAVHPVYTPIDTLLGRPFASLRRFRTHSPCTPHQYPRLCPVDICRNHLVEMSTLWTVIATRIPPARHANAASKVDSQSQHQHSRTIGNPWNSAVFKPTNNTPGPDAPNSYDANVTSKTFLFQQSNDPVSECRTEGNTRVLNIFSSGKTATKSAVFRHRCCEKYIVKEIPR